MANLMLKSTMTHTAGLFFKHKPRRRGRKNSLVSGGIWALSRPTQWVFAKI